LPTVVATLWQVVVGQATPVEPSGQ
jgi:hypothetical protein